MIYTLYINSEENFMTINYNTSCIPEVKQNPDYPVPSFPQYPGKTSLVN